jgi:hypothetical protein
MRIKYGGAVAFVGGEVEISIRSVLGAFLFPHHTLSPFMLAQLAAQARRRLGKGLGGGENARQAVLALSTVLAGVRPCLLFDYMCVEDLPSLGLLLEDIAVALGAQQALEDVALLRVCAHTDTDGGLDLDDAHAADVFVCNVPGLRKREESRRSTPVALMDVTEGRPVALKESRGEEDTDLLMHALSMAEEARGRAGAGEVRMLPDRQCGCSLYGALLGYPVVYWTDPREASGNSLGMVPLRLFQVRGLWRGDGGGRGEVLLASFSVPTELRSIVGGHLEAWQSAAVQQWSGMDGLLGLSWDVEVSESEVVLPEVAL